MQQPQNILAQGVILETMPAAMPQDVKKSAFLVHGGVAYLSGQVPTRLGGFSGTTYAGQIMNIIDNLDRLLREAHSSKNHLLKVQVFLRNMAHGYRAFRDLWTQWLELTATPPVRPLFITESGHVFKSMSQAFVRIQKVLDS
eukprot:jgi/Botrbrau1/14747/Bobra.0108s0090.1